MSRSMTRFCGTQWIWKPLFLEDWKGGSINFRLSFLTSVHTGADDVHFTITSYNIYQTLKLLETYVVLTLVSLDQMVYKPQITSYNIYQTLKLLVTHVVLTLVSLDQMVYKSQITSYNIYQTVKLPVTTLVTHIVLTLVSLDHMTYKSQSSVTIFIKLSNYY